MIKYAAARGLPLPPDALAVVDQARLTARISNEPQTALKMSPDQTTGEEGSPAGVTTPPGDVKDINDNLDLAKLSVAHAKLATVVAPATPSTILVITDSSSTKHEWVRGFGATTYARWLFLVAVVTVMIFLVVLLRTQQDSPSKTEQFLLTVAAALVGSVLYVMFNVSRQVRAASIDRAQEGVYTAHLVLGLLSGTALAFLVIQPVEPPANGSDAGTSIQVLLTRPLIALLGGFAVEAVYRILQRLVTTLEALVRGSEDELVQAQNQAAKARAAAAVVNARAALAARLVNLYGQLDAANLTEKARADIEKMIEDLLPMAGDLNT